MCFVNSTVDAAIYRRDFEKICIAIAKELTVYLGKAVPFTPSIVEDKPTEKDDDIMEFTIKETKQQFVTYYSRQ